jgi:hypothetical protein
MPQPWETVWGGKTKTTTYPVQTLTSVKPRIANTIVCFKKKPEGVLPVYNAPFIVGSVKSKYGLPASVRDR